MHAPCSPFVDVHLGTTSRKHWQINNICCRFEILASLEHDTYKLMLMTNSESQLMSTCLWTKVEKQVMSSLYPPFIDICTKKELAFIERLLSKLLSHNILSSFGSKDLWTQKELALLEKLLYRLLSQTLLPIDYFLKGRVFSYKR